MTNTVELEKAISKSGLKKIHISNVLGISRQGFKKKCENKSEFTASEINILCDILNIESLEEKEKIFFAF